MKRDTRHIFCAAMTFLALAQIPGEDLALLGGFSLLVRRFFICAGLFCDLFFTAQFLVGLYTACLNRKARQYFFHDGGWMDFLASVPLLVLRSLPAVFGLVAGVPLAAGAARVGSGLRFLRFLKLFRVIPFGAAEKGAPAVLLATLVLAGSLFGPAIFRGGFPEAQIIDGYAASALTLAQGPQDRDAVSRAVREFARTERALLLVKQDASAVYSRYADDYYEKYYGQEDYLWRRHRSLDFFFGLKPLLAGDARRNLVYFCVLAALLCALFLTSRARRRRESP